jgi:hypothetical protein
VNMEDSHELNVEANEDLNKSTGIGLWVKYRGKKFVAAQIPGEVGKKLLSDATVCQHLDPSEPRFWNALHSTRVSFHESIVNSRESEENEFVQSRSRQLSLVLHTRWIFR